MNFTPAQVKEICTQSIASTIESIERGPGKTLKVQIKPRKDSMVKRQHRGLSLFGIMDETGKWVAEVRPVENFVSMHPVYKVTVMGEESTVDGKAMIGGGSEVFRIAKRTADERLAEYIEMWSAR